MNQPVNNRMSVLIATAMDICWLQAGAGFVLFALFKVTSPILFIGLVYVCGALIKLYCLRRARMRLHIILAHAVVFSAVFYLVIEKIFIKQSPFSFSVTFANLFSRSGTFFPWTYVVVILLFAVIIWYKGGSVIGKFPDHRRMILNFDLGLAMFFLIMTIKLLIRARFDTDIRQPALMPLFFPMFVLGLTGIGFQLHIKSRKRRFAAGFQKIGIVASFIATMLALGFSLVTLFYSQLHHSAEVVSGTVKKVGPVLTGMLVWLVQLMWSPKKRPLESGTPAGNSSMAQMKLPKTAGEPSLFGEILKWGMVVITVIVVILFFYFLIRLLIRYLLSRTREDKPPKTSIRSLWARLLNFLRLTASALKKMGTPIKIVRSAEDLYHRLLRWGRRSGLRFKNSETLMEYQVRLARRFPNLKAELGQVVQLIYQETYNEMALTPRQIRDGKQALRHLGHPKYWARRMKTWFLSSGMD